MNPENLKYTAEHEWVAPGSTLRVGITDYAQSALGDIVYVDLPKVGSTISAGATCGEIESTKSVSELFAPVSGTITAVNDAVVAAPESINTDPYGAGWLFEVEPSNAGEIESLMDAAAYTAATGS